MILFSFALFADVAAQDHIFDNEQLKEMIRRGVEATYNFDFVNAEEIFKKLSIERPGHPATMLFNAMLLDWENFPLTVKSPKAESFTNILLQSIVVSENMLKKNQNDIEGIFFDMVARLMLMQFYADNDLSKKVISHVSPTYKLIRQGFALKDKLNDFYYSTGIYNYYREAYPEANPRYRTVAFFLPKGDKKLGLKQLQYAGQHSVYLGPESLSFLYYIYLFYEKNYSEALNYTKILNDKFPDNPLYISTRIQILLLLKQYDDAVPFYNKLFQSAKKNTYFEMLYDIYSGIIEEKKNKNYSLSEKMYLKAISLSQQYVGQTDEQLSFAYFGLNRLYILKGDLKKSKEYRKIANSLTSFRDVNYD